MQFNTNVFNVFRTIGEVVLIMRRQTGGGYIIITESANGFFGVPCVSV